MERILESRDWGMEIGELVKGKGYVESDKSKCEFEIGSEGFLMIFGKNARA